MTRPAPRWSSCGSATPASRQLEIAPPRKVVLCLTWGEERDETKHSVDPDL